MKAAKAVVHAAWGRLGIDQETLIRSLLVHRNTPTTADGLTPAQKAMGRSVADGLLGRVVPSQTDWAEISRRRGVEAERQASYANNGARELDDLVQGEAVVVQDNVTGDWSRAGVITRSLGHRDYEVTLDDDGSTVRRGRRLLRPRRGRRD